MYSFYQIIGFKRSCILSIYFLKTSVRKQRRLLHLHVKAHAVNLTWLTRPQIQTEVLTHFVIRDLQSNSTRYINVPFTEVAPTDVQGTL